ncbi:exonuclease SbcCD subunit D C-terminal domain-containing protein [Desulfovibrio sp. OttesenSCG-928-G15]|nr:exonuclease SbcCD subunit D C-terminal domain-containing protein [Desulfovibrio sp. OttesenSCG-928-G15]
MKILHTSDWHLGRLLHGRRRHQEMEAFLDWLHAVIAREKVDVLLVAGDVFDSTTPGNLAQELYYRFLARVALSPCRHVVIIAGNHDSPSFVSAPQELLRSLHIHVVGAPCVEPEDEVLLLKNAAGEPQLMVCAVPFLRDKDIRLAEPGESIEDKERKTLEGITAHYERVFAFADQLQTTLSAPVPVIAMGHLFTNGARTTEGDGVRELYVGSLAHVPAALFPEYLSYVALGHLHMPQTVGGTPAVRYCGSPLPMSFGEAEQEKAVCLIDCRNGQCTSSTLAVPVFQKLVRLQGTWEHIEKRIGALAEEDLAIWLEIILDDEALIGDVRARLDALTAGTKLEILRIRDSRIVARVLGNDALTENLAELDLDDVFARCLEEHAIPDAQKVELTAAYKELLTDFFAEDIQAG